MTRKVKGNASCWLTRKTMKIPPQNHSLGNIPIVIVPDFLPVRCVPTKNSSPPTPQFLPCLWPKFASSRNRWMGRAECRAVPNTHPPMMIFFSPKIGAVAGSRVGATRDGRASDMQLLELLTPLVTTNTPTRRAGQSSFEFASAAADSSRMQLHSNYPCAKIKDGRDKVNS